MAAGDYELKETYRNGLGQTAESTLFTIENRPAPVFTLTVSGHENTTETPCNVRMELTDGRAPSGLTKIWRVKGEVVAGANSTVLDCANLPAGAYLITLEVITEKLISSTEGTNLIRLPGEDLSTENGTGLPSTASVQKPKPSPLGGSPSGRWRWWFLCWCLFCSFATENLMPLNCVPRTDSTSSRRWFSRHTGIANNRGRPRCFVAPTPGGEVDWGTRMAHLAQVGINGFIQVDDCAGSLAALVVLRLLYVWNTRIRPLEPSLEAEWAADCEHLTTATVRHQDYVSQRS